MTLSSRRFASVALVALLAPVALGFAACGGDSEGSKSGAKPSAAKPTLLSITTSDAGKRFSMQAPKSIKGGLVEIRFKNAGKVPHEAGLVRVEGDHSLKDVLKIVSTDGPVKIPDWLYAEGGVATTPPGQELSTTENLRAGHYFVIDTESEEGPPPAARGAVAEFDVTPGTDGALPATEAKVVAKTVDEDKYEFEVSGLKAGPNKLLFKNESDGQIHHIVAFPIVPGKSLADVKKFLSEEGEPSGPPPVDFMSGTNTEVLDGKRQLVTTVNLKAGKYALVCFLNDRDELKPHFKEGMLKEVDVK